MKKIYADAADVYVWLGEEADNSNVAMEFLVRQAAEELRQRGPGYHPVWPKKVGEALHMLCQRQYWRRIWIIQELLHAQKIIVWCGTRYFDWKHLETMYLKLRTLEDTNWFTHLSYHANVMQSTPATMIWQRAHYRHPATPAPRLQTLIEIFRDWQCTDIRDKVFALVGMAAKECSIIPDYDSSPMKVYHGVLEVVDQGNLQFASMLSQILGLSEKDINMRGRSL